jgi:hypothetical protein
MFTPLNTFDDYDTINRILAECAMNGMAEPIDCPDCDPMDWAEVTGLADELFEESHPEAAWRDSSDPYPEDDFILMG